MMRTTAIALALTVAGCSPSPAHRTAEQLDNAAVQSDPAAAEVLRNAADDMRDAGSNDPQAQAQNALDAAGTAQTAMPAEKSSSAPTD